MSDRKKAIETLKQLRLDYEEFYEEHNNEVTQAYDMAISSLETDESYQLEYESTTKNDLGVDYISRDSAIKALGYDIKSFEFKSGVSKYMDDIAKLLNTIYEIQVNNIKNLISATPQEPRKGHWIVQPSNKEQGERDFIWWKCSECGQVIFSETEHDRLEFHAFCGRCGADMREVEE